MTGEPLVADGTPWNGDYGAKERKPKPSSVTFLAEVAGDTFGVDDGALLPVGSVLDLVDLAAGRCAHRFMEGSCVTVSVDKGKLRSPVRKGELVRCKARVVSVGSSSITVEVETEVEKSNGGLCNGPPCFVPCFVAQLTFVAIDRKTKRPLKNVPRLIDDNDPSVAERSTAIQAEKLASRAVDMKAVAIDSEPSDSVIRESANWQDPCPESRVCHVAIDETLVELRKQYLPRHENFGGIVFGGDLLMLLERAALYCARRFCGVNGVSCVRMHSIHFRLPIEPTFLLVTRARVVKVGRYTMEVEVVVLVDRTHEGLGLQVSHTGYFTVVSRSENDSLVEVKVGLDIEGSTIESLRAHCKAALRVGGSALDEDEEQLANLFV